MFQVDKGNQSIESKCKIFQTSHDDWSPGEAQKQRKS